MTRGKVRRVKSGEVEVQEVPVARTVRHPDYQVRKSRYARRSSYAFIILLRIIVNDIALLKLESPAEV